MIRAASIATVKSESSDLVIMKCCFITLTTILLVCVSFTSAKLTEFLWSDDEVSGVYENEDGSFGIRFVCRQGQLEIQTLDNITLLAFNSFDEVNKRMARSVHMLDGKYLQHKHTAHRHLDRAIGSTTKPINETLSNLLKMDEISLLEDASRAVGDQGVTGKNTSMILPFHMFALKMTQLLDTHSRNPTTNKQSTISQRQKRTPCDEYRKHKDCKGLCGARCWCWEWVCGDCCYHQACFDHDTCCEVHGYFSKECAVFPSTITENCDEPYSC